MGEWGFGSLFCHFGVLSFCRFGVLGFWGFPTNHIDNNLPPLI